MPPAGRQLDPAGCLPRANTRWATRGDTRRIDSWLIPKQIRPRCRLLPVATGEFYIVNNWRQRAKRVMIRAPVRCQEQKAVDRKPKFQQSDCPVHGLEMVKAITAFACHESQRQW